MHRALRIALKTIKWVAVVLLVGAAGVVLVNLRDEDLSPEAKALAAFHPSAVPDEQNAYLALVGFDAPSGIDPIAAGAKIVKEHDAAARSDPLGTARAEKMENAPAAEHGDGRLQFVGDMDALCEPISRPCLPAISNDPEKLRAMMSANGELVARYLALQNLPAFANTSVPDPMQPMPSGGWAGARRLLFAQAVVDAKSGREDRALAFLAADMSLWRRVLAAGSGLIEEMIAVRMLASGLALLSEFIASPDFDVQNHQAILREMLVPLSAAERNSTSMFARESSATAYSLSAMRDEGAQSDAISWMDRQLIKLFFKKDASLNEYAILFTRLQALASHGPASFAPQRERMLRDSEARAEPGISWLYNPIGKIYVRIAYPSYPDFVARVFDLAAYVQLVRAQLEVRLANLSSSDMPQFLGSAGAETRNPYDDKPFAWNAETRSLSFEPMNPRTWRDWNFKVHVPPPVSR